MRRARLAPAARASLRTGWGVAAPQAPRPIAGPEGAQRQTLASGKPPLLISNRFWRFEPRTSVVRRSFLRTRRSGVRVSRKCDCCASATSRAQPRLSKPPPEMFIWNNPSSVRAAERRGENFAIWAFLADFWRRRQIFGPSTPAEPDFRTAPGSRSQIFDPAA